MLTNVCRCRYHGGSARAAATINLPLDVLLMAVDALQILNHIAVLSLPTLHAYLTSNARRTEFLHLIQFWLKYRTNWYATDTDELVRKVHNNLLHELLLLVGAAALEPEGLGRAVLRFGQLPVILQMLAELPFEYFMRHDLAEILFPTLIAACYHDEGNRLILQEEMSLDYLIRFIRSNLESSPLSMLTLSLWLSHARMLLNPFPQQ